ncbi:sarcosine oxidase subunit gamma [Thalassospira sp.]|uniref:sarcosine oxidase subunit gamma n=1 Tax=Thalassospira sp. TaxID=1912094 RepID=UPI0027376CF8|nr:sarcosine oxidase subunit gamma family protein [Thalassospira sp.]MDP2697473.1 sarcosine oxidase subunit gamma family protein [Thalassospira sp.]
MADLSFNTVRTPDLDGFSTLHHADGLTTIRLADPADRLAIWCEDAARNDVATALGLALPDTLNSGTDTDNGCVLRVGPEEYLAIRRPARNDWHLLEQQDFGDKIVSLTDVSHRNIAFILDGPNAAWLIASGCPQDVRDPAFPVGKASRTLFGKAEIILWRTGHHRWVIEIWRSFAPYLADHLTAALNDPAIRRISD